MGLGNIWRFPVLAGTNGGGSFLLLYVIFLFSWGIPLLIAEFSMGRKTNRGTIGAFHDFVGKRFAWMGLWMVVVSTIVGFYYGVVMGWTLKYFTIMLSGGVGSSSGLDIWNTFIGTGWQVIIFQVISILITAFIVYKGVESGVEKACSIMMPTLIILLVFLLIWAVTRDGAIKGLEFLFIPKGEYLGMGTTWTAALGQIAFSTSAGFGMGITYAAYLKKGQDTTLNSVITALGNSTLGIMGGIIVLCSVFALSASPAEAYSALSGESVPSIGFPFIFLTQLFGTIPGGWLVGAIFFIALSFAALTSMISTMEIGAANFIDVGWDRKKAVRFLAFVTILGGIPSALITVQSTAPDGGTFLLPALLENQMVVWDLGLITSGAFVAFAVYRYGINRFYKELVNTPDNDLVIGRWWPFTIKYLFPLQFTLLLAWTFYEVLHESVLTFATMLVQLMAVLMIAVWLNSWVGKKVERAPVEPLQSEEDPLN